MFCASLNHCCIKLSPSELDNVTTRLMCKLRKRSSWQTVTFQLPTYVPCAVFICTALLKQMPAGAYNCHHITVTTSGSIKQRLMCMALLIPLLYRMNSRQLVVMLRTYKARVMTSKICLPHSSPPLLHCRTWASGVAAPQASMYRHLPPGMHLPVYCLTKERESELLLLLFL